MCAHYLSKRVDASRDRGFVRGLVRGEEPLRLQGRLAGLEAQVAPPGVAVLPSVVRGRLRRREVSGVDRRTRLLRRRRVGGAVEARALAGRRLRGFGRGRVPRVGFEPRRRPPVAVVRRLDGPVVACARVAPSDCVFRAAALAWSSGASTSAANDLASVACASDAEVRHRRRRRAGAPDALAGPAAPSNVDATFFSPRAYCSSTARSSAAARATRDTASTVSRARVCAGPTSRCVA